MADNPVNADQQEIAMMLSGMLSEKAITQDDFSAFASRHTKRATIN